MNQPIPENIAQTILTQAAGEAESRVESFEAHDGTEVQVLVARGGVNATPIQRALDDFAAVPRSRAGKVRAFDIESFAQLILRDRDGGSMVFADVGGAGCQFQAVLDYHRPLAAEESGDRAGQRHGREVIEYEPSLSKEWRAWTGQAKEDMTPAQFAAWIDEHLPDIADPRHLLDAPPESTAIRFGETYGFRRENLWGYADPEKMVNLSRGLEIREGATLKSVVRLESGEADFTYETEHTDAAGKPLKVPTRFLLSIPVFEREAVYLVPVKLSYKKRGPSLTWSFDLFRPDRFRDDAIEGMRQTLAAKLTPDGASSPLVPIHLAKRI